MNFNYSLKHSLNFKRSKFTYTKLRTHCTVGGAINQKGKENLAVENTSIDDED